MGRMKVAWGWLVGRNPLPSRWLEGGFRVAWGGFAPAFRGSKLEVGSLIFGAHHKHRGLQGTYTQRYNGRHRLFGHLFQGRYRAVVVDGQAEEDYFPVVSTYIHLNPARAGLIRIGQERLKRYPVEQLSVVSEPRGPATEVVKHRAGDGPFGACAHRPAGV